jgi:MFS family permease
LIVEAWGWPWIFYVNGPLGLLVIVIALVQMSPDGPLRRPDRGLLAEAAVLAGAMTALLLGFSLAAAHALAWLTLCLLAAPPLALWWRMNASRPVRGLMRTPGVSGPLAMVLLNAVAVALVEFLAPFYLQRELGMSAGAAGTAVLAFPAGMVIAGPLGGLLADRWSAARTAWLGVLVATAGAALMIPLGTDWSPADLSLRLAIAGAGTGLFAGPNFAMIMSNAPGEAQGTAGAAQSLARQLGFSLGPALATTAWSLSGYGLSGMRAGMSLATATGVLGLLILRPWVTARTGARRPNPTEASVPEGAARRPAGN